MKIETKLALNNIKKNKKRYLYIIISIILCSFLLFTTMLMVSSIRTCREEIIDKEYSNSSGYHIEIENAELDYITALKNIDYIDKIFIQKDDEDSIEELEKIDINDLNDKSNINIYIKFKNVKNICQNADNIIQTLNLFNGSLKNKIYFNQQILSLSGLIDVHLANGGNNTAVCVARVNMNYVLNFFIVLVAIVFLVIFLIILYSNFFVTMNERRKEYAVLNSIGATENQLLKITMIEGSLIGVIGIIIGIAISFLGANIILDLLNNILKSTIYSFKIIPKVSYFIILILVIFYNIYLAVILSLTKINGISTIKNNSNLKNTKKKIRFQKLFSIEGKLALKNLKRNKSKYIVLTILLIASMVIYICISTYIEYEKNIADTALLYDFDVQLEIEADNNIDYKTILENYEKETENKVEYIEYQDIGTYTPIMALVTPQEAIIPKDIFDQKYNETTIFSDENGNYFKTKIIGLDKDVYSDYIKKINGNYGDIIVYNNYSTSNFGLTGENNFKKMFDESYNIEKIQFVTYDFGKINYYDNTVLKGNFILTDEYFEYFKDFKYLGGCPIIFVNKDIFEEIQENYSKDRTNLFPDSSEPENCYFVRIKCDDVVDFSTYIKKVQSEKNIDLSAGFYTLEQQEAKLYLKIIQLVLKIVIITIILIGIVSGINIINASLHERIEEFKILNRLGATNQNINKVLIYECIFVFIKATVISLIISTPIVYFIINYITNMYEIKELLVPFANIAIFYLMLLVASITVTLGSSKFVKNN